MGLEKQFGELRSFLERKPSSRTFDLIIEALEAGASDNEAKVRAEWLPYAQQRLESWPDHTRLCPKTRNAEFVREDALWHPLVRAIDFVGQKPDLDRVDAFLSKPAIAQLKCLDMRSVDMPWEQIVLFAKRAPFELDRFGLRRNGNYRNIRDSQIFTAKMLSRCQALDLRGWSRGQAGLFDALLRDFPLQHLRALDVSGGVMSTKRLREMLDTGKLEQLEELRMRRDHADKIRQGFIGEIVAHGGLPNLRVLQIIDHEHSEIEALATCEAFGNVEELRLDGDLSTKSLERLLESPHLTSLESLRIVLKARQVKASLAALASSPALKNLKRLHVTWNMINVELTPQDYIDLFESPNLANLTHLAISLTRQDALESLLGSSRLENLEELLITIAEGDEETLKSACAAAFHDVALTKLERFAGVSENMGVLTACLADTPLLGQLKALRVEFDDQDDRLADLFHSPQLGNLEMLDLSRVGLLAMSTIFPALLQCEHLEALHYLLLASSHHINEFHRYRVEDDNNNLPAILHTGFPETVSFHTKDWMVR